MISIILITIKISQCDLYSDEQMTFILKTIGTTSTEVCESESTI